MSSIIIGTDTFPSSAIGLVFVDYADGYIDEGTGTLVGTGSILTASHLFDAPHGAIRGIEFIPGFTSDLSQDATAPFGGFIAGDWAGIGPYQTRTGFVNIPAVHVSAHVDQFNISTLNNQIAPDQSALDMTMIGMDVNLQNIVGGRFYLYANAPAGSYTLFGYPHFSDQIPAQYSIPYYNETQTGDTKFAPIESTFANGTSTFDVSSFFHTFGSSGGPLAMMDPNAGQWDVVGVLSTGGQTSSTNFGGDAARITAPEVSWLLQWRSYDDQLLAGSPITDSAVSSQFSYSFFDLPDARSPKAYFDYYNAAAGVPLTVTASAGPLSNDTDPYGLPLSAALVQGPMHGTLALQTDGSFTYKPQAGFVGTDNFFYRSEDSIGAIATDNSDLGLVTITVNGTPVAHSDVYSTKAGTSLTVAVGSGVLANDTDPNGLALSAAVIHGPAHGTLTLQANGSFNYTPLTGFVGTDTFSYRATDSNGVTATDGSDIGAVTISVNGAPVAHADNYQTKTGTPLTVAAIGGVLSNDTDPNGLLLSAAVVSGPAHGTLALQKDGSFSYTPQPDYIGTDTFSYRATDNAGVPTTDNSDVGAVTIAVVGATIGATINVHDISVPENTATTASSFITSISNPNNHSIGSYAFWDAGDGTGHFSLNGVVQADGQWIVVDSTQLSSIQYIGGSIIGSETLYVEVYDSTTSSWSDSSHLNVTTTGIDLIQGSTGNDTFRTGGGDKSFNGVGGHDTLIFQGSSSQYSFTHYSDGSVSTTDSISNRDGVDIFINTEFLQFTDKTIFVENTDNANIARLYSAAFDRAPDQAGLSFWEDIYTNNISAAVKSSGYYIALAQTNDGSGVTIADGFIQSGEFQHLYGALTSAQFIAQMYENVLGRAPDTAGYNFWLSQMQAGTTQAMVLVGFAESPENVAKSASWLITA